MFRLHLNNSLALREMPLQKTHTTLLFLLFIGMANHLTSQVTFGGTTTALGSGCYQLTGLVTFSGGYVYEQTPLNLNEPFDLTIPITLGDNNGGADGITFVLKGDISTFPLIGSSGGAIGFSASAFSSNAIGIEVDTWQNAEFGDPVEDHIGIFKDGLNNHTSANALAGPIQANSTNPNVEDGEQHNLRIVYDPLIPELSVFFDCDFRISYIGDLIDSVFNGDTLVHWGVLGTTGGGVNVHTMCMPAELNAIVNDLDSLQLCGVDSIQLNAGGPQIEYLWQPGIGLSDSTVGDPWIHPQDTATYIIRRIYVCDTSFDTLYVDANDFGFELGNDTGICDSVFVLNGPANATSFLWSLGDTTQSISVQQSGTYTLIAENNVCRDTDSISVTLSYVDLPDQLNTCEDAVTLSVEQGDDDILWSTGSTNPSISVSTSGTYWASVSNTDCIISDTTDVFFREVTITRANDTVLCEDSLVGIAASGATSFLWSTGDTEQQIALSVSDSLWVVASNAWCADTDSLVVNIESFQFDASFLLFCGVDQIRDTIRAGSDTNLNYLWNTGSTSNEIEVTEAGIYVVSISSFNCLLTDTLEVQVAATPRFSLGEDQLICLGEGITLRPDTLWSTVNWSTGAVGDSLAITDTGSYVATMDNAGCLFSDTIQVRQYDLPQDPSAISTNVLTPNQDGINDQVGLVNIDQRLIENYRFWVYNRWGALVFESNFLNHKWNGVLPSGEPAAAGVYYFIIEATTICDDLPRIEVKDHITLMR